MNQQTRREFLTDVGRGVVAASVGAGLAADLGFSTAFAENGPERLTFGPLEPLVALMQETPGPRLLGEVVTRLRGGTPLRDIVTAGALANARTFGGEDYIGFHTMMAMGPAYHMAGELPDNRKALPVLKVLFRNTERTEAFGRTRETLRVVQPAPEGAQADALREATRGADMAAAERIFAALGRSNADDAFNTALHCVEDGDDVHRVVLPYRAWDMVGIIGREHAYTLLRQSIRHCANGNHSRNANNRCGGMRTAVVRMLDEHRLLSREPGTRQADDRWVEELSNTIFRSTSQQAIEAAAAALAEGMDPAAVAEAVSLAANQLVLRDNGRTRVEGPDKPIGSIHGDSIGVHACDSANAWRNLSRAGNRRNKTVCVLLSAWQVAHDRTDRGGNFQTWEPYPRAEARRQAEGVGRDALLPALEEAIRGQDQIRAAAIVHRYGELNLPDRPLWDVLLRYSIMVDGALHAEKFYRTTREEYAATRPAFRWRQPIALARVVASANGRVSPSHAEATRLLGI